MKFCIEIECDNAAFEGMVFNEIADILKGVEKNLKYWADSDPNPKYDAKLFDTNGNVVGHAKLVE